MLSPCASYAVQMLTPSRILAETNGRKPVRRVAAAVLWRISSHVLYEEGNTRYRVYVLAASCGALCTRIERIF